MPSFHTFWLIAIHYWFHSTSAQDFKCHTRCSYQLGCYDSFCYNRTEFYTAEGTKHNKAKCSELTTNVTAKHSFYITDGNVHKSIWYRDCSGETQRSIWYRDISDRYDFQGNVPAFLDGIRQNGCELEDILGNYWLQCQSPLKLCESIEIDENSTYSTSYERICISQDEDCPIPNEMSDYDKNRFKKILTQWHESRDRQSCDKSIPTTRTIFVTDKDKSAEIDDLRKTLQNTSELWCYLCTYKEACNQSSIEQLPTMMCPKLNACYTKSNSKGEILQRGCMHIDECAWEINTCDQTLTSISSCAKCCAGALCNRTYPSFDFKCFIIVISCCILGGLAVVLIVYLCVKHNR